MKEKKVSFGRVFWPSLTASIVILVIIGIVLSLIIGSLIGDTPQYTVGNKAVLHMKLKGDIGETSKSGINGNSLSFIDEFGLADILYGLEKASKDDRIKGVFIELEGANCGEEILTC